MFNILKKSKYKNQNKCTNYCTDNTNLIKKLLKLANLYNIPINDNLFNSSSDIVLSDNPTSFSISIHDKNSDTPGIHTYETYCTNCAFHKPLTYIEIRQKLKSWNK
jgi:hypothetical protein